MAVEIEFASPRHGFIYTLPGEFASNAAWVGEQVDLRTDEFLLKCQEFMNPNRCKWAIKKISVELVPDYVYFCASFPASNLCGGEYFRHERVAKQVLWDWIRTNDRQICVDAGSQIIRDRQQMTDLSNGNLWWASAEQRFDYFCEALNHNVLPVFTHEVCHGLAGGLSGHSADVEECQRHMQKEKAAKLRKRGK